MELEPELQPLARGHRQFIFIALLLLFITTLPFLFLYATGYRFNFGEENTFVSTGGIFVAAERTGAEIYIDNELVRETRTFRKAFYAQGLDPGTHRIHVQKPDHHTWVKELPVYPHLVTEAQAFNLPLVPQVRTISPWKNVVGTTITKATSTLAASSTNTYAVFPRIATSSLVADTEYVALRALFATTSATSTEATLGEQALEQINTLFMATTSTSTVPAEVATTTKIFNDVKLFEQGDDIYAAWRGAREDMPYYYCAEDFELLGTSTLPMTPEESAIKLGANIIETDDEATLEELVGPIQSVTEDSVCDPAIRIDRKNETVHSFDFYPGSTDLVIMARTSGIYVIEIDDRGWQNVQPLVVGADLDMRIHNGNIYIFDGTLIYQVVFPND